MIISYHAESEEFIAELARNVRLKRTSPTYYGMLNRIEYLSTYPRLQRKRDQAPRLWQTANGRGDHVTMSTLYCDITRCFQFCRVVLR